MLRPYRTTRHSHLVGVLAFDFGLFKEGQGWSLHNYDFAGF